MSRTVHSNLPFTMALAHMSCKHGKVDNSRCQFAETYTYVSNQTQLGGKLSDACDFLGLLAAEADVQAAGEQVHRRPAASCHMGAQLHNATCNCHAAAHTHLEHLALGFKAIHLPLGPCGCCKEYGVAAKVATNIDNCGARA